MKPGKPEWKPPPAAEPPRIPPRRSNRPQRGERWSNKTEMREVFDTYDAGRHGYLVRYKFTRETPCYLEGIGRCTGYDWVNWCLTAKEIT